MLWLQKYDFRLVTRRCCYVESISRQRRVPIGYYLITNIVFFYQLLQDTSFNWSKEQQGYILSSFFWGYILTQVPGGMMSRRWGAKWVVAGGLVVAVIATLISAPLAYAGAGWLALARIINGLGQVCRYVI